jgi:tetratricopeptide (TPR) repeat protein
MNEENCSRVYETLQNRDTDYLMNIYEHGTLDEWEEDTFEIIRRILAERNEANPQPSLRMKAGLLTREVEKCINAENWTSGLEAASQLIQIEPTKSRGYYYRGIIQDELDQLDGAWQDLQTAVHLDPDSKPAWKILKFVEKELEERDSDNTRRSDFNHTAAKDHLDQALEYLYEDELDQAIAEMDLARESLPQIGVAYNYLGLICEEMGRVDDAVESYLTAIRCNPRMWAARENLVNARIRQEGEQYHQADLLDADEVDYPEFTPEEIQAAEAEEEVVPMPGWYTLDEPAFWLRGWPGNRTRAGRSGLDLLDARAEEGHLEGVIFLKMLNGQFRTKHPIYLCGLFIIGLFLCLPIFSLLQETDLVEQIIFGIPMGLYLFIGVIILINVVLSITSEPEEEDVENGRIFY